jgi:hypothetical protein
MINDLEDTIEYFHSCVEDGNFSKSVAWDLMMFYISFVNAYPEFITLIDMQLPDSDMGLGFRFILDDDTRFIEIEHKCDKLCLYSMDRETGYDESSNYEGIEQLKPYLEKLSKKVFNYS